MPAPLHARALRRRRLAPCLLAATLAASARPAGAQPAGPAAGPASAADKAAATALFKEAKALMDARRHAEACPKLAESYRLDPAGGTLLNLAVCHEGEGKLATAWSEFNAALSLARRDGREERVRLAQQHLAALEPILSRLTIRVPEASRVDGLEVRRDGVVVGPGAFGSAIPVDSGDHRIEATAPQRRPWSVRVTLAIDSAETVEVPVLEEIPASPPPPAASAAPSPSPPPPPPPGAPVSGYVALGVGAVGVALGTVFGVRALLGRRDSDRECPGDVCTRRGYDLNESAKRSADVSTVSFGVGLLASGLGAYLLLSHRAPPAASSGVQLSPAVGPGQAGLDLRARW